jgi:hypothetical protein
MRKSSTLTIVSSLLCGGIFTIILLAQMNWRTFQNNCQHPMSTAKTGGCAIMEYGYPKRWVTSDVNVGEQNVVFATTRFNKTNLIFDWLVLSGISFIALYLISIKINSKPNRPKPKRK